ncbi:putative aspartic peptidase A1 family, aspartic peptidase domain superfamily, xylanase inhibitor [Helianthus annuus]|nr:putative aspartic peptidase A1 family, aspartic peptidase domain superfamily, xylanase inhibitor [Helianthus annuus]
MRSRVLHDNFTCIGSRGMSVDDEFPAVTFHFENSVSLKVDPHDYMFIYGDLMCLGWQENYMGSTSERDIIVLGELMLLDKLFLYDLEKQTIGWTEYNCESYVFNVLIRAGQRGFGSTGNFRYGFRLTQHPFSPKYSKCCISSWCVGYDHDKL